MKTLNQKKLLHHKLILYILTLIFFSSCGTRMKIDNKNFNKITNNFSGTFSMYPHKVKSKQKTNYKSNLLHLLNQSNVNTSKIKKVSFKFNENYGLMIYYESFFGTEIEYFKGKFKKNGYYEIYFSKKRVEIPPLFPLFYSKVNINRIRIGLNKNGDLIIDNYQNRSANIFLLAGGNTLRSQSFFKKIKQ